MKRSKRLGKVLLTGAMLLAFIMLFGVGFPDRVIRSSVSYEPAEAEPSREYIAEPAAPLAGPPTRIQAEKPSSVRLASTLTSEG